MPLSRHPFEGYRPYALAGFTVHNLSTVSSGIPVSVTAIRTSSCNVHSFVVSNFAFPFFCVHLHMGSGQDGLKYLFRLIDETDIPASRIIPTHVNRSASLFKEAMEYAKKGGYIDITTGVPPALVISDSIVSGTRL